jgi:hypothetical protein
MAMIFSMSAAHLAVIAGELFEQCPFLNIRRAIGDELAMVLPLTTLIARGRSGCQV